MLIALANSKGGVGKTTVSVHYAVAQAERGRKTALIDSDAQGSSTRWLQDIQDSVAVFPLKTADDVIDQAPKIVSQFDVVVADGPAGLSEVTRALLLVADLALLPCCPSALDLRAAQDAIRVVQQAQMIRKGPPRTFLLPNKLQTNYRLSRELLETADSLGIPSLKALKLRQAYADAAGQGTVVWRLPGTKEVADEINDLFAQIDEYEKEIAH